MKIFKNLKLGLATVLVATLSFTFPAVADQWDGLPAGECHAMADTELEYQDCLRTVYKQKTEGLFRLAGRLLPPLVGDAVDYDYLVRLLGMGEDELRAELSYEVGDVTKQIALVRWQYPDLVIAAFRANERYRVELVLAGELADELFVEVDAFKQRLFRLNTAFNQFCELHLGDSCESLDYGGAFLSHPELTEPASGS